MHYTAAMRRQSDIEPPTASNELKGGPPAVRCRLVLRGNLYGEEYNSERGVKRGKHAGQQNGV